MMILRTVKEPLIHMKQTQAFPAVYTWVTYAICLLIQKVWTHCVPLLEKKEAISPEIVEITSVYE
jgi:hypothetical protein